MTGLLMKVFPNNFLFKTSYNIYKFIKLTSFLLNICDFLNFN